MFQKGQRVACVNGDFPPDSKRIYNRFPCKGVIYTIRAVFIGRGNMYQVDSGKMDGEVGVLLEEIRNPYDPSLKDGLRGELGFKAERFAPFEQETESAALIAKKEDVVLIPA